MSNEMEQPVDPSETEAGRMMRYDANKKSLLVAYLLWFFLGFLAAHRFYLGATTSALILVALWVIGMALSVILIGHVILLIPALWWVVDAFLIPGLVSARNNSLIAEIERR